MSFRGAHNSGCITITGILERAPIKHSPLPYPGNALPPNSTITITLEDVSLMDAPSRVIAQKTMQTGPSPGGLMFPIPFTLLFDSNLIESKARYNISVRVETNTTKTLAWISPNQNPVLSSTKKQKLHILLEEVPIVAVGGHQKIDVRYR